MLQITGSFKILLVLINIAESNEFGIIGGGDDYKDKIDKRLLFKNLNGAIGYLSLETRLALTQLRKAFTKTPIF